MGSGMAKASKSKNISKKITKSSAVTIQKRAMIGSPLVARQALPTLRMGESTIAQCESVALSGFY
jgi:hypothetical protein